MRSVYVGDASDEFQVTNATAVAVRGSSTTFAMGPASSTLTYFAAQQSFADGALMLAAYASGPEVISQNEWTFGTLPAEIPGVYDKTTELAGILSAAAERIDARDPTWYSASDRCAPPNCRASLVVGFLIEGHKCHGVEAMWRAENFTVARRADGSWLTYRSHVFTVRF